MTTPKIPRKQKKRNNPNGHGFQSKVLEIILLLVSKHNSEDNVWEYEDSEV